jgi:hypothetical protein
MILGIVNALLALTAQNHWLAKDSRPEMINPTVPNALASSFQKDAQLVPNQLQVMILFAIFVVLHGVLTDFKSASVVFVSARVSWYI